MCTTPVRLVIGDQNLEARLWDNPAARSLIDQLPLTLGSSDYGGQEVLAEPPLPLTMEGMPSGESAPSGTIGYYAPSRAVVLYYSDIARFDGIVRIGEMDGDLSILRGWGSAITPLVHYDALYGCCSRRTGTRDRGAGEAGTQWAGVDPGPARLCRRRESSHAGQRRAGRGEPERGHAAAALGRARDRPTGTRRAAHTSRREAHPAR
ncbi:hypothetical protein D1J51_09120 [Leucobacter sp. wl10]|nr:hypothetical protein D1J51_09120 [Leucobacter sp. wl10]